MKTNFTAVCFFENDNKFDNINGLWNAIYYNNKKLLNYYKNKFENVYVLISPDYSLCGDVPFSFNIYNILRSRVVSLWLVEQCNKIVIPVISFTDKKSLDYTLNGLEDCFIVSMSTVGYIKNENNLEILKYAIFKTVNSVKNLKMIIIYTLCNDNSFIKSIFSYATKKGIKLLIPNNKLRTRNMIIKEKKYGKI